MKKERNMEIKSLSDERLVKINPLADGFYDNVPRGYKATTYAARDFMEAVDEAKDSRIPAFWRPIFDPSHDGKEIVFKKNSVPAVGHSFSWWKNEVNRMNPVESRSWKIGTNFQYIAFLVWLINSLVEAGWSTEDAVNAILDSRVFGRYGHKVYTMKTDEWETKSLRLTGKHEICGIYDLTNTRKLICNNNREEYLHSHWIAGPNEECLYGGLSQLKFHRLEMEDYEYELAVAWLVLE